MKVLIFEDEAIAADRIVKLLGNISDEIEVVGTLKSIKKGLEWFNENSEPDFILSDIQLLDGLSFEIYKKHPVKCPIIFTTAFDQYALQAFEVNGVDYLLKPIQEDKLAAAIQKLKKESAPLISSEHLEELAKLLDDRKPKFKERFLVKLGQKITSVPTDKISYFFSEEKVSFLVTQKGEKFPVDNSLEELENILDPKFFFRINRKYIITLDSVAQIHPYFKGRLKLELNPDAHDDDIVVSADKTPVFKSWLDY